MGQKSETATLGGGCFWCLEAAFLRVRGVLDVVSGYSGGATPDPGYQQVCSGTTGHAEVVQVTFDPGVISFRDLLHVFFTIHDPTTLNRQGADVGTQYRSAVYFHSPAQEQTAREVIEALRASGAYGAPIVTEVAPIRAFYPAEEEHHRYFEKHAQQPYCQMVIAPKIARIRETHPQRLAEREPMHQDPPGGEASLPPSAR